ncbi:MAG: L-glutamate gamma-semialdehyde dehydrogenase [Firmicutes bacterium]|nr:L-glutamate gamma-semialdehyde dehydrogenase [Bacillota bacterium]
MTNSYFKVRKPENEKVLSYEPGSKERKEIKKKLVELKSKQIEIPLIIGGKEIKTGNLGTCVMPHNKSHVLATYHRATKKEVEMAIKASLEAKRKWDEMSYEHKASIFLKAAELLSGPFRSTINASTMLCQSKTVFQAEIDSACELIDFLRYNAYYMTDLYNEGADSSNISWNRMEYRPLEGFIFAVTPFNFTSIAANLPTAPAMVGNVVNWKPASASVYSNYFFMKLLQKAGLPKGVINFIPGDGSLISDVIMKNENFSGIHFTGSTKVFKGMWEKVGENIKRYKSYPRIVGETGGKDFVFAHKSAEIDSLVTALIRGAFEYQGQKCSAASRAYIPESIYPKVKEKLINDMKTLKMGDVEDFTTFVGAVIDETAFNKIKGYIDFANKSEEAQIICGGEYDLSKGYFITPTIIKTTNPKFKTMEEEIFGPVLTIYVYKDKDFDKTLDICDETSNYGLTGGCFALDREAIEKIEKKLYYAAGNFYINDKPTGAVVGKQPFGGSRNSGTNDKAGSKLNLIRWMNPRVIKENFNPPKDYRYPYMEEE